MTRSLLAICTSSFLLLSLAVIAQDPPNRGTVHVRIVDASGKDLGEAQIQSFRSGDNEFASRFAHNVATEIPFGIYQLNVRARGFWSTAREVRVFQSQVWAVVQLELGMGRTEGGLATFEISGIVNHLDPKNGPGWVRLTGVYSNVILDAKLQPSGELRVAGIPQGKYVLTVSQNGVPLRCELLEIPASKPVVVDVRH